MTLDLFLPPRAWGLPNPSPFCVKLETAIRMLGVPYTARTGNPVQAPRGKLPYARLDGEWLADSQVILDALAARGHGLDGWLRDGDRARAHLLRRTLEEATYFLTLHQRWLVPAHYAVVHPVFFGGLGPVGHAVGWYVRRRIAAATHAQGVARYTDAERDAMAVADFDAIAAQLGDAPFLFGDRPCTADAALYGFACQWLWAPFDGALQRRARAHARFVGWSEAVRDRYWTEIPPLA